MGNELKSYKPYARIVSIISGLIILIAGLDYTQIVQIFPDYASQIKTIMIVAGILSPMIAQESRVGRAEELAVSQYDDVNIPVNINVDTDDVIDELKTYVDESLDQGETSDNIEESDIA